MKNNWLKLENWIFQAFSSQGYTVFNICCLFLTSYGKSGPERLPLLLYQACIQPLNFWSKSMFTVMPVNQTMIYLVEIVWISGNLYLCRFLRQNTNRRIGIKSIVILSHFCRYCQALKSKSKISSLKSKDLDFGWQ